MLDKRFIRDNPAEVEKAVREKSIDLDVAELLKLDLGRVVPDESLVQHGYASASFGLELPDFPRHETLPAVAAGSPGRITRPSGRVP